MDRFRAIWGNAHRRHHRPLDGLALAWARCPAPALLLRLGPVRHSQRFFRSLPLFAGDFPIGMVLFDVSARHPATKIPASIRQLQAASCPRPALSVAVRVKNEAAHLPRLWESLKRQSLSPAMEVVFLDSGSTDGTVATIRNFDASLYTVPAE